MVSVRPREVVQGASSYWQTSTSTLSDVIVWGRNPSTQCYGYNRLFGVLPSVAIYDIATLASAPVLQFVVHTADGTMRSNFVENVVEKNCRVREEFHELIIRLYDDTAFSSSVNDFITHPAYFRIVSLGKPVLKLIFEEMEKERGFWFNALEAITKQNPISEDMWGDIEVMTNSWLTWGRENEII